MDSETKEIINFLRKSPRDALKREAADLIEKQAKEIEELKSTLVIVNVTEHVSPKVKAKFHSLPFD
jgi:hypothetical protein